MIKNRFFRKAFVCSAIVGFAASIAGCNLGFMESEDSDLVAYLEESTTAAFSGTYKAKASGEVTLKLSNGSFSTALKNAVANATATSTVDVSNYFDLTLVDDSGTDVTSTLIREQKVYALGAVTSTSATSSGTTSLTPDTETLSVKIVIKMQDGGTAETASGNLYVTATGDATASGNIMTCLETTLSTFEITTAEVSLQAASTAQLCTAAATTAAVGKGVAVLSLGGITLQAVSKGDAVATGSIGTDTTVTAYALEDCTEEASSIPVYIDSDVYTGAVSLTVDSDIISNTTVTATNCSNIKVIYYGQDFESGSTDWSLIAAANTAYHGCKTDDSSKNANTSSYIYGIGGRSGDTGSNVAVSNSTDGTIVEFDLKFDGVYAGKSSSFALLGAANTTNWLDSSSEILTFSATSTTAGYVDAFTINGTDYTTACSPSTDGSEITTSFGSTLLRGSTGWLHVKATLDFTNSNMDLVVTKVATGSTVCSVTDLAFMDGTAATSLAYIYAAAGKTYGGTWMDNILVYKQGE